MQSGSRRRPRHARGMWVWAWIAFGIITAGGLLSVFVLVSPPGHTQQIARSAWRSGNRPFGKSGDRKIAKPVEEIYPYSVITGGVHNKQQFEEAMRTDPVAAAHYADFNAAKFRIVKLRQPMEAYVSFRVGDNVYWTSHKLLLRKGSELISDGTHLGRTRCGNRISEIPRLPTYNHEPSARELNTPVVPAVAIDAFHAVAPVVRSITRPAFLAWDLPVFPELGDGGIGSASPADAPFIGPPLIPGPLGSCASGMDPNGGRCSSQLNKPPHIISNALTPEDSTWTFFVTGAALLGLLAFKRKRIHTEPGTQAR